jgi:surface antigen
MMRKFFLASMIAVLLGSACPTPARADGYPFWLGLLGAGLGGLFGNQFGHGGGRDLFIIGGALVGGILGTNIGNSLEYTHSYPTSAGSEARTYGYPPPVYVETGYQPNYVAPSAPPPPALVGYGDYGLGCRRFIRDTVIDDEPTEVFVTACQQPDGSWQVVQ